jgi:hypothetical protein
MCFRSYDDVFLKWVTFYKKLFSCNRQKNIIVQLVIHG